MLILAALTRAHVLGSLTPALPSQRLTLHSSVN